ncbi:MAG: MBL fold metallo-hydrolase [Beijerinckiaceae bacterium]
MRPRLKLLFPILALICAATANPAAAQHEDRCIGPIAGVAPRVQAAAFHLAAAEKATASISYVGHSTFVIESPGGVAIATDYNDYVRPRTPPLVATMNRAHDTHFTLRPDPAIRHVLRGWSEPGTPAEHDIRIGDVRVRNVPTNIREGYGSTMYYGNSIFVFEIAGLCVAHLGHLHHTLTPKHLLSLGPIDVVLVPVDGSYTLNVDGMMETLKQINAPLMIPMHYFGPTTLQRFIDKARDRGWDIERSADPTVLVSRDALPKSPKVLVLPPGG